MLLYIEPGISNVGKRSMETKGPDRNATIILSIFLLGVQAQNMMERMSHIYYRIDRAETIT